MGQRCFEAGTRRSAVGRLARLTVSTGESVGLHSPGTRGSSGPGGTSGFALTAGLGSVSPNGLDQTDRSSTNRPLASVPVRRSSTIPPGLTRMNQRSFCLPLSGIRLVIGYAATTCQSATESETSSYGQWSCPASAISRSSPLGIECRLAGARIVVGTTTSQCACHAPRLQSELGGDGEKGCSHLVKTSLGPSCCPTNF